MKRTVVFALAILFLIVIIAPSVRSQENDERSFRGSGTGESVLFDLMVLRPAGVASILVGTAGSMLAWPLMIGKKNSCQVSKALLKEPLDYTFVRPLGNND